MQSFYFHRVIKIVLNVVILVYAAFFLSFLNTSARYLDKANHILIIKYAKNKNPIHCTNTCTYSTRNRGIKFYVSHLSKFL